MPTEFPSKYVCWPLLDEGQFWKETRILFKQISHSEDRASWYILIIKPTRSTNFSNLFWNRTLHVSDWFSVHHQESSTVYTAIYIYIYTAIYIYIYKDTRGIEVTGRQGRRRRKLLDDLKERRGYSHLKEEALDRTMLRVRFGRSFGPVVRQTTKWMNHICCAFTDKRLRSWGLEIWVANTVNHYDWSIGSRSDEWVLGARKNVRDCFDSLR